MKSPIHSRRVRSIARSSRAEVRLLWYPTAPLMGRREAGHSDRFGMSEGRVRQMWEREYRPERSEGGRERAREGAGGRDFRPLVGWWGGGREASQGACVRGFWGVLAGGLSGGLSGVGCRVGVGWPPRGVGRVARVPNIGRRHGGGGRCRRGGR